MYSHFVKLKTVLINALILVALILNSCALLNRTTYHKPEKVAGKYLYYLGHDEYEKAKDYGTENAKSVIDLLKSIHSKFADTLQPVYRDYKITDLKCTIYGEEASCKYYLNGIESKLNLIKTRGKWLVDIPLEEKHE